MPPLDEDMTEPDRPVTRRDLREELDYLFARNLEVFATKEDLRGVPTKDDLKGFVTKDDLKGIPTKDDPKGFATKDDVSEGLKGLRDELRSHFDAVAESFTSQFGILHDALRANTIGLDKRVKATESGYGSRLLRLETRVTAVELGHPRKKGQ